MNVTGCGFVHLDDIDCPTKNNTSLDSHVFTHGTWIVQWWDIWKYKFTELLPQIGSNFSENEMCSLALISLQYLQSDEPKRYLQSFDFSCSIDFSNFFLSPRLCIPSSSLKSSMVSCIRTEPSMSFSAKLVAYLAKPSFANHCKTSPTDQSSGDPATRQKVNLWIVNSNSPQRQCLAKLSQVYGFQANHLWVQVDTIKLAISRISRDHST